MRTSVSFRSRARHAAACSGNTNLRLEDDHPSERCGLLYKPMNPDELVAKILLALDRGWQQEEILAYVAEYSWERISGDVLNQYGQVLVGKISVKKANEHGEMIVDHHPRHAPVSLK